MPVRRLLDSVSSTDLSIALPLLLRDDDSSGRVRIRLGLCNLLSNLSALNVISVALDDSGADQRAGAYSQKPQTSGDTVMLSGSS